MVECQLPEKYSDAERLLKRRLGEIVSGKFAGLGPERVRMTELFDDVVEDYRDCERRSVDDLSSRLRIHLVPFFGEVRAADFTSQHVKRYVAQRRREAAQNATINRELAIVRRAFRLGAKCDPPKVARIPYVQLLKESNVRTGFLEYECYIALRNELAWYLRPLFVTAYHVGGRRGELTSIQWPQVDFNSNQIHLHGPATKNEEARTLPIYGEMREWLMMAKEIRDQKYPSCSWVFYTAEGERLYWFYKAWEAACKRAGVPELLFHDLRRSAVRNMERAGIPRKVAMSISGHKTEHIYRRYDIVAHRDLADAAVRMDHYFGTIRAQGPKQAEPKPEEPGRVGTLLGTPGGEQMKTGAKRSGKSIN